MSTAGSQGEYCISCNEAHLSPLDEHWQVSDSCSPPDLTPHQVSIIHALLTTTGRLEQTSQGTAVVFETPHEHLVHWVASAFGVLTATVSQTATGWKWSSHPAPAFEQFSDYWLDGTTPVVPVAVDPTPTTLAVAYAAIGTLRQTGDTVRPVFDTAKAVASPAQIELLTQHFYPLQFENVTTGAPEVYLNQTEDFFEYVGTSFAGRPEAWPEQSPTPEPTTTLCPHCLHEFRFIEAHWSASSTCSPPLLSWRQHELVEGVLLGGGTLEADENGYRLVVEADRPALLKGLDETFGTLSAGIQDRTETPRWVSRASPELSRFTNWMAPTGEIVVPTDLHHTKEMLRVAYALAGDFIDGRPQFTFNPTIDSDAFAESFFDDFDPMSMPNAVVLRSVSEFFSYIGWVPLAGCEQVWPN